MFFRTILALGGAIALSAQPVAAQEEAPADQDLFAAMAGLFAVEPLTPEQEARLPAAREVVDHVLPPGTLAEVMQSTLGRFFDPVMNMAIEPSAAGVAEELGFEDGGLDMSDAQAREAAEILDPAWTERRKREFAVMKDSMAEVMAAMEPAMRQGMAEAYAVHFTAEELADVGAFFETPSGAAFARKSYLLASDPRIMAAAMRTVPAMMEGFAAMEAGIEAATADLPPQPGFDDLTAAQRERLAQLTGLSEDELAAGMALAEEQREAESAFGFEP